MKLVIVESPKKSETIARYLGEDYKVLASEGHIRDLSTHGKGGLGIDIENGFIPDWEISDRKRGVIAKLSEAAKKAEVVYLATDPDREGEAISYHLADVLGLPKDAQTRLQFREITRPAVLEAIEHPKKIDMHLVGAQEARRMQDRIIGFKVSSLLQRTADLKSAGRVQSSTLKLIVDRQKAIDAFVPQEYWTIDVMVRLGKGEYKASLTRVDGKPFKCKNKEEVDAILARIPSHLSVTSVTKTQKSIFPKPPFTTSTLQQEAYSKYGFSNTKTQSTAQRLYEGLSVNGEHVGLITYMRTDSTRISPNFYTKHAIPFITETYGSEYIGTLREGKEGKNIQDAHEAIRPTGTHRTPEVIAHAGLSDDQVKLYRLIYCRALASLMASKRIESTAIILSANGLSFSLSGARTLFPGFSVIYGEYEEDDAKSLPEINQGEEIAILKVQPEQKFTKPDPLYNEASIVKAMEEKGIGRPSTYASTIKTLKDRKYVTAVKGVLSPTEDGKKVVETLEVYFPDIVSSDYTALMESKLDKVEEGEETSLQSLKEFYEPFLVNFKKAQEALSIQKDNDVHYTGGTCPECGAPLVYRKNKKGEEFVGCSAWPKCHYIQREKPKPEYTGETCPDCGAPLVYKKNKKGEKFIGCSAWPSCSYVSGLNKAKKPHEQKVYDEADYVKPCPVCGNGHMVKKLSKRTEYLGCTNFPKCRHVEWLHERRKGKK